MFAQQVIEDIWRNTRIWKNQKYIEQTKGVISLISCSEKFYINAIEKIHQAVVSMGKYTDMVREYARMPFDKCYFDYIGQFPENPNLNGVALIVCRVEKNLVSLQIVIKYLKDHWRLIPVEYLMTTDMTYLKNYPKFITLSEVGEDWFRVPSPINRGGKGSFPYNADIEKQLRRHTIYYFLSVLAYLNFKKITIPPAPTPDQFNRRREKKGKPKIFSYHTIFFSEEEK